MLRTSIFNLNILSKLGTFRVPFKYHANILRENIFILEKTLSELFPMQITLFYII